MTMNLIGIAAIMIGIVFIIAAITIVTGRERKPKFKTEFEGDCWSVDDGIAAAKRRNVQWTWIELSPTLRSQRIQDHYRKQGYTISVKTGQYFPRIFIEW